jgi:hypothetical protein
MSGVFVCWAKVGRAKLIANPTRITTARIFIVFFRCFGDLSPNDLLRDFSESPGAEETPFGQSPELHSEWMPRPIRCQ